MVKYGLFAGVLFTNVVAAFHVAFPQHIARPTRPLTATMNQQSDYPHQDFERAIECASTTGLCDDGELNKLADKLEACEGCFFFTDKEGCKQEKVDRQDVVDILRMDAALQLRQVYLENANLFKERVENARNTSEHSSIIEGMDRAIECASKPGLCKDDELNKLANALESYEGCLIDEDCEQEMIDMQDVVDILRMDAALQLRQVYLQNVNSFKEAVEDAQENVEDAEAL